MPFDRSLVSETAIDTYSQLGLASYQENEFKIKLREECLRSWEAKQRITVSAAKEELSWLCGCCCCFVSLQVSHAAGTL